jgi:DNA-nicking Smr family endonuclease
MDIAEHSFREEFSDMSAPTIRIKQDLDRTLEAIRSNGDLSEEAKRCYIGEAYEKAQVDLRAALETVEREIVERQNKAEKALFEIPYPYAADEVEKAQIRALRRSAYDSVYTSLYFLNPEEARGELERLLTRAERTQDPELADAVYHVATERGERSVADAYLQKMPKAQKRWEEFTSASQEVNSVDRKLEGAMGYGLMKPPELSGMSVGTSQA